MGELRSRRAEQLLWLDLFSLDEMKEWGRVGSGVVEVALNAVPLPTVVRCVPWPWGTDPWGLQFPFLVFLQLVSPRELNRSTVRPFGNGTHYPHTFITAMN